MRTIQKNSFFETSIRTVMTGLTLKALITAVLMTTVPSVQGAEDIEPFANARDERNRLVETFRNNGADALPELQAAITNESETIRRTAAHLLVYLGDAACDTLVSNLGNDDVEVRYVVLGALENLGMSGNYVEEIVTDESAVIRRRFYLDILPEHLLVDGAPPDDLIASLASAYDAGVENIRYDIIKALSELPITVASAALLRRAADPAAAAVAAAGGKADSGHGEIKALTALVAFRTLLTIELEKMRELTDARQWQQLVDEFGDRDISSWPNSSSFGRWVPGLGFANEPAEAYYRIGQAYYELGHGEKSEQMLRNLIEQIDLGILHPREREFYGKILNLYHENYQKNLPGNEMVRDHYVQMQFNYGNRLVASLCYRAAHRASEARASYEKVLKVEGLDAGVEKDVMEALANMKK